MKKYIFLFICSFCLSGLNGMTNLETQLDTIIPGREDLPPPPPPPTKSEQQAPNYQAPTPPPKAPNYQAPTPPPRAPNYQAPNPPQRVNNPARPVSAELDPAEMDQLLADLKKMPIEVAWRTSNGGYSVGFRKIILDNYVRKQAGISNWFAACATLAGTFDQVTIRQNEVMQKTGYWNQFSNSYLSNTYNLADLTQLFLTFKIRHFPMKFHPNCGEELLHLLNKFGPIIVAAEGVDKAVVITEVACNSNNECFVHIIDFAPWTSNVPSTAASTQNNRPTTIVPDGTKVGFMDRLKGKNYKSIGQVGSGSEIKLSVLELLSKFSNRSTEFMVIVGADENLVQRALALISTQNGR